MLSSLIPVRDSSIEAVFFDFDGVIVDSVPVKTDAFRTLFAPLGPRATRFILAYHKRNGGIDRHTKIRYVLKRLRLYRDEEQVRQLGAAFGESVRERIVAMDNRQGIDRLLEDIKRAGLKAFVVSGTPEEELRDIIIRKGLADFFNEVCGSPRRKREILETLSMKFEIRLSRSVFIGDAPSDFAAAQAVGMYFVGVPTCPVHRAGEVSTRRTTR
ncbi:MAG: HAD family hydrolase [Spirochaetales bacterium]|nr:HAD family hydrolase [Leptospiraceae bacterium]MCP5482101.1 HAD family hydrolase [Spirochaetales bacterium]MCP5484943.1 HAD family hydrolase [Spirochaetales bacterium]